MARKRKKNGDRQLMVTSMTPTTVQFPIIATEVFWELNPELHTFLENKPPTYFPSYYNYTNYSKYGSNFQKGTTFGCAPRRLCVPRPCAPV